MRNHRLALLLALCLLSATAATAEGTAPAALSAQELFAWRDTVWAYAKAQPLTNEPTATHDPAGTDTWLYAYAFGLLETIEPPPGADEGTGGADRIESIELLGGDVTCPRGIAVGDPLARVLAAYPDENPTHAGSAAYAALYVQAGDGDGDETGWGWLLRRGRTVLGVQYAAGMPAADISGFRVEPTLLYVIEDGHVSAIRASGFLSLLTEAEREANLDAVRTVAALDAYTPPQPGEEAPVGPFAAEDLVFSGLSFIDGTPEAFARVLGTPREESEESGALALTYDEALVEFAGDGGAMRPSAMLVMGSTLPGPRGIAIGDDTSSVTALFGGQVDLDTLTYQCEDETGRFYVLTCTFHDDMLVEYLLYSR